MRVRKSSRAILLNPKNEIFLFKLELPMLLEHPTLWVTPGGGVENDENFEQALYRELHEELGLDRIENYRWIFYRNKPFVYNSGEEFMSEERYYLIRVNHSDLFFGNMDELEKRLTKDWKWWSVDEIRNSSERFFANDLDEKLTRILHGLIPEEPSEI